MLCFGMFKIQDSRFVFTLTTCRGTKCQHINNIMHCTKYKHLHDKTQLLCCIVNVDMSCLHGMSCV